MKMVHLAKSTKMWAFRLDISILRIIKNTIVVAFSPNLAFIDALTLRFKTCERRHERP